MTQHKTAEDGQIKRYLLGELSDEEQLHLEERLLEDAEYYTQLQLAEEDLADDYACGRLTQSEVKRFESYFMAAPQRSGAVRFAEALHRHIAADVAPESAPHTGERPAGQRWWRQQRRSTLASLSTVASLRLPHWAGPSLAAAGAVMVVVLVTAGSVAVWINHRADSQQRAANHHLDGQLAALPAGEGPAAAASPLPPAEQPAPHQDKLAQLPAAGRRSPPPPSQQHSQSGSKAAAGRTASPQPSTQGLRSQPGANVRTPHVVTLALVSGRLRSGGELSTVRLAAGTKQLQLELGVLDGEDYASYRAEVRTAEGREVARSDNLAVQQTTTGTLVRLAVPASLLTTNDYIVTLSGASADGEHEPVSTYYFRVALR